MDLQEAHGADHPDHTHYQRRHGQEGLAEVPEVDQQYQRNEQGAERHRPVEAGRDPLRHLVKDQRKAGGIGGYALRGGDVAIERGLLEYRSGRDQEAEQRSGTRDEPFPDFGWQTLERRRFCEGCPSQPVERAERPVPYPCLGRIPARHLLRRGGGGRG